MNNSAVLIAATKDGKNRASLLRRSLGLDKVTGLLCLEVKKGEVHEIPSYMIKFFRHSALGGTGTATNPVHIGLNPAPVIELPMQAVLGCRLVDNESGLFQINSKSGDAFLFQVGPAQDATVWVKKIFALAGIRPVVVVLGETGAGKSLFASALTGLPVSNSIFTVSNSIVSVTTETRVHEGTWFGSGDPADSVVVVDTPGLNDTDGRDDVHIVGMMRELMERGEVHAIAFVLNSEAPRLLNGTVLSMLKLFEVKFGPDFWRVVSFVFSHWFMDDYKQENREKSSNELSKELHEELGARFPSLKKRFAHHDLPCTFVDSMAVVKQDGNAKLKKIAMEELRMFSLIARTNQPHPITQYSSPKRTSVAKRISQKLLPSTTENVEEQFDLPDTSSLDTLTQEGLFKEFLRERDLIGFHDKLLEQGIETVRDLRALQSSKGILRKFIGMTDVEIARINSTSVGPSPDDEGVKVLVQGLKKFKVPHAKFEERNVSVKEALMLTDDMLIEEFGCKALKVVAFHNWKQSFMAGAPVYGPRKVIWSGALVERNAGSWSYDSDGDSDDEDTIPEDGHTVGTVIGWHTIDGDKEGEDPPKYKGWVRVHWMSSGYKRTYRMGVDGIFDLQYVFNPDIYETDSGLLGISLEGVEKLLPRHLRRTFKYPANLSYSHLSNFDTRDEVLSRYGLRHGDIVQLSANPEMGRFQVIGLRPTGRTRAKLHLQPLNGDATGAGVLGGMDVNSSFFTIERKAAPVKWPVNYANDGYESEDEIDHDELADIRTKLTRTFPYVTGVSLGEFEKLDPRTEQIKRFLKKMPQVKQGTVVRDKVTGSSNTCIGVGTNSRGKPVLFWHVEGAIGAGISSKMASHLSKYTFVEHTTVQPIPDTTKPPVPRARLQEIAASLQCTFSFRKLGGDDGLFDIRDNVLKEVCGYEHGTVFRMGNGKLFVVVGVTAESPDTGLPPVATPWFFIEGRPGAGMLQNFGRMLPTLTRQPGKMDLSKIAAISSKLIANNGLPFIEEKALPILYDCFLSHAWGLDSRGRNVHNRVKTIAAALKKRGLRVWFDEEMLVEGNINEKMFQGIEQSATFLTFITQSYLTRASEESNVRLEFTSALAKRGRGMMVPVVMEKELEGSTNWHGPVEKELREERWISCAAEVEGYNFESVMDDLHKIIIAKRESMSL